MDYRTFKQILQDPEHTSPQIEKEDPWCLEQVRELAGMNLAELRRRSGLTIDEFADLLGYSRPSVINWLYKNSAKPAIDNFAKYVVYESIILPAYMAQKASFLASLLEKKYPGTLDESIRIDA